MKFYNCVAVTLMLMATSVMADDAGELKAKLASVKLFSAHFEQTVFDIEGKKLQQSSGDMLVYWLIVWRPRLKKDYDRL